MVAWAAGAAQAQAVLPSTVPTPMNWTWVYEGNQLPDSPSNPIEFPPGTPGASFIQEGNWLTSESISGGVYNASTVDSNGATTFWTPSSSAFTNLNSDRGYTLEWRVKVDQIDSTAVANPITLGVDEGRAGFDRFWVMSHHKDASGQYWARLQGDLNAASVTTQITPGAFNKYRVTVKHNTATLFMNDVSVGSVTSLRNASTNRVEFGDFTGTADASFAVDYVRLYDGSALRPIESLWHLETYVEPGSNRRFRTAFSQRNDVLPDYGSNLLGERMWYQVSTDNGATYDTIRPIIQNGPGYNASHPIDPIYAGLTDFRSSEWIPPLRMSNGEIIVPFQYSTLTADGNDYYNPYGANTFTQAGVMIANWNTAKTDIEWNLGATVTIDAALSSRGLIEPAVVETNTPGRLLMVMRGSNENHTSAASRNWKAVSNDYGRTWTPVSAMTYSDGSSFYSPSAMSDVRKNRVSDRLYWFGNLISSNADGNSPRYPLVMAEIDEATLGLIPGSSTVIAAYTPGAPYFDTPEVQFSNFTVVENPITHKYTVSFTRIDFGKPESQWIPMSIEIPVPLGASWKIDGSGNWHSASNWGNGAVPNGVDATARLGGILTSPRTVTVDSPLTLGSLIFNNMNMYNLTGTASLSIQSAAGSGYLGVIAGGHKINLPLVFASNTNISVSAGATLTLANPVTIKAGRTVSSVGTGSLLIQAPLTIEAGGTLALGAAPMTVLGAVSLANGSRVDVGTQSLSVDYHGQTSPHATIESQLTSGYANGDWNGFGLMTSAANSSLGIGWADDFSNQNVDVKFTYYGDANLSGSVDSTDFNAFIAGYGLSSGAIWTNGDFNYDDRVDTVDFNCIAGNFGVAGVPGFALGAVVPEPSSCVAVALTGLLAATRRRSR
jgi:hypothetical protein